MSSHVTIRTTTTTSTSAILLNIGYFKTAPGLLKLFQAVLGAISVTLTAIYFSTLERYSYYVLTEELFFLLMATTCLITTTLLLVSYTISITSATILPKTIFEVIYHLVASILLLISAAIYLMRVMENKNYLHYYNGRVAASVLGIVNAILYGIALFFACRQYRNM